MNFQALAEVGGFVIAIIGILWNFIYGRGLHDSMEQTIAKQIEKLWDRQDEHQKQTDARHLEINKDIASARIISAGIMERSDSRNEEILRRLTTIENLMREELNCLRADLRNKMDKEGRVA